MAKCPNGPRVAKWSTTTLATAKWAPGQIGQGQMGRSRMGHGQNGLGSNTKPQANWPKPNGPRQHGPRPNGPRPIGPKGNFEYTRSPRILYPALARRPFGSKPASMIPRCVPIKSPRVTLSHNHDLMMQEHSFLKCFERVTQGKLTTSQGYPLQTT